MPPSLLSTVFDEQRALAIDYGPEDKVRSLLRAFMVKAIERAPEDTVRATLHVFTRFEASNIGKVMAVKSNIGKLMTDMALSLATTSTAKKRKAPTTQTCVQCNELFEEGDTSLSCWYHPYDMELAWNGYPYNAIQDNELMRKFHPYGFIFTCCNRSGTNANKGCMLRQHGAADGKRTRYPFPGSDGKTVTASEEEETVSEEEETASEKGESVSKEEAIQQRFADSDEDSAWGTDDEDDDDEEDEQGDEVRMIAHELWALRDSRDTEARRREAS